MEAPRGHLGYRTFYSGVVLLIQSTVLLSLIRGVFYIPLICFRCIFQQVLPVYLIFLLLFLDN